MNKTILINKLTKDFNSIVTSNIYDMSNEELIIANYINDILNLYDTIEFKIPNEKKFLMNIIKSFSFNLRQCYHYLFYPSNKAPNLIIRILSENIIILKFLLDNSTNITKDLYNWENLNLYQKATTLLKMKESQLKLINTEFYKWKDKTYESITKIYGKEKIFSIINNNYGWSYSKKLKSLSLYEIAKNCDATLAYDLFSYNSKIVHSNTYSTQLNISRLDNNTFRICIDLINIITLILNYFYDYIIINKDFYALVNLLEKTRLYHDNFSNLVSNELKKQRECIISNLK